jgi:hypothetical protein
MKAEITATLNKSGALEYDRQELSRQLAKLKRGEVAIMITDEILPDELRKRSNAENRYYFGVVCKHATAAFSEADGVNVKQEEAHERLKRECNGRYSERTSRETGETVTELVGMSTRELSTIEFETYLDKCRLFLAEWFGVYVPLPNEPEINL